MGDDGVPVESPPRDALVALVGSAARAPSSHNTQPWRFRVDDGRVSLVADPSRQLSVTDPEGRELVISCGAALFTLTVAARRAGLRPTVDRLPEGPASDVLATVDLVPDEGTGDGPSSDLADAIPVRRTTRGRMEQGTVPEDLVRDLVALVGTHGAWLAPVAPDDRGQIADLVAEGDRAQFGDRAWRAELASWMRPRTAGDGLTVPRLAGAVVRRIVTTVDVGTRTARTDHALAREVPLLVVLGTDDGGRLAWLHAGEALQHLLLHAAAHGLQAGFLNQPCQVPALRPRLADLVGRPGTPQLVLRLGRPRKPSSATPRRPVAAVVEP